MRILALGDVVGKPGRVAVSALVSALKNIDAVDFVVVNGENAAGGSGITPSIVQSLLTSGVDVITSGDHIFRNHEVLEIIEKESRLLRPFNMSPAAKGAGFGVFETKNGVKVGVANVIGRVYINIGSNPYIAAEEAVRQMCAQTPVLIVDIHAEATSEKIAMGWFLDGKVSLVFGTHTHVQTSDARILPNGTAYITDLGMSGPHDGVIGREKERVLSFQYTDMPTRFELATGDVKVCGVIVDINEKTGKATAIESFTWVPETELPGKTLGPKVTSSGQSA